MGKGETFMLYDTGRHAMTRWTACCRLSFRCTHEMADVTHLFGYSNVRTLDNLRMAARTPELKAPPEFTQVIPVIEEDGTFELHFPLQ